MDFLSTTLLSEPEQRLDLFREIGQGGLVDGIALVVSCADIGIFQSYESVALEVAFCLKDRPKIGIDPDCLIAEKGEIVLSRDVSGVNEEGGFICGLRRLMEMERG
jgi:hypothetical protein